ncbi:VOC family protein [Brachybacterium vulturis]|uniref:VOC family protein n=1 Tax=Brachybacterium vulturis TaxID=2017484 RepID=UPI00373527AE
MFLENLGVDALDPLRLGRFWEAALGTSSLTVEPDLLETRLDLDGTAYLDLCFVQVPAPNQAPLRLQLALRGGAQQADVVERLRGLGASDLDSDQGEQSGIVLADIEGRAFRVSGGHEADSSTGPLAAVLLESADPERDAEFWAWLSGWALAPDRGAHTLRHPSLHGPLLELVPERAPKRPDAKNPIHLDVRLEPGEDPEEIAAEIERRGGREMHPDWGELPWRVHQDPSGNEFCVLPAPAVAP